MASMRKLLSLSTYPAWAVFIGSGVFAALFAWMTYDLFRLAMANSGLIRAYGVMALVDGGAAQLAVIALKGASALATYFGFKACEADLMRRYRRWQQAE